MTSATPIRRPPSFLLIAATALAAVLGSAGLARADDMQICHDESGDVAIAACTRVIESGKVNKRTLAYAYTSRGVEWRAKGEVDRAIWDHSEAIRTDATVPEAWYNRGNAWRQKKDPDRAIKDYDEAIRLRASDPDFFTNRGLAYQDKGDEPHAQADFAVAERLKKQ
jgi:tetratricopeptide (TPR) repeat protein